MCRNKYPNINAEIYYRYLLCFLKRSFRLVCKNKKFDSFNGRKLSEQNIYLRYCFKISRESVGTFNKGHHFPCSVSEPTRDIINTALGFF